MKVSLKEIDGIYPDVEIEFEDKGLDLVSECYVSEFKFRGKKYLSQSNSIISNERIRADRIVIDNILRENNLIDIKDMVGDMETIESLLGNKGRFVGDMVHISIIDLANCIRAYIGKQK